MKFYIVKKGGTKMTNEQRDELLINLSKGMSNLQELVIETRNDLKETKKVLRAEIKASAEETKKVLRAEIKVESNRIIYIMKQEFRDNAIATSQIFHDSWKQIRDDILKSKQQTLEEIAQNNSI